MALGMALAERIQKLDYRTYAYALVMENAMKEAFGKLQCLLQLKSLIKLTVIIDYNKWQATDRSQQVMAIEPLSDKWKSFGWDIQEIDGHDFSQIKILLKS